MLFTDALVQLKARVPVYRTGWEPQDGYLTFMPCMAHVWKIVLQPVPNAGNYIFSVADLEADDWVVYKEPQDVLIEPEVEEVEAA